MEEKKRDLDRDAGVMERGRGSKKRERGSVSPFLSPPPLSLGLTISLLTTILYKRGT